jgi:hypothetical protein
MKHNPSVIKIFAHCTQKNFYMQTKMHCIRQESGEVDDYTDRITGFSDEVVSPPKCNPVVYSTVSPGTATTSTKTLYPSLFIPSTYDISDEDDEPPQYLLRSRSPIHGHVGSVSSDDDSTMDAHVVPERFREVKENDPYGRCRLRSDHIMLDAPLGTGDGGCDLDEKWSRCERVWMDL